MKTKLNWMTIASICCATSLITQGASASEISDYLKKARKTAKPEQSVSVAKTSTEKSGALSGLAESLQKSKYQASLEVSIREYESKVFEKQQIFDRTRFTSLRPAKMEIGAEEIEAGRKIAKWFKANPRGNARSAIPLDLMSPKMKALYSNPDPKVFREITGFKARDYFIRLGENYEILLKAKQELEIVKITPTIVGGIDRELEKSRIAALFKESENPETALREKLRSLNLNEEEIELFAKKKALIPHLKSFLKIAPAVTFVVGLGVDLLGESPTDEKAVHNGNVRTKSPSVHASEPNAAQPVTTKSAIE